MNRPDTLTRLIVAAAALAFIAAWFCFPWQAFVQPFPVLP